MKMKSKGRRSAGSYMPYGAPYGGPPRALGMAPLAGPPMMPLAPLTGAPSPLASVGVFGGMPPEGFRPPPFDRYLCDDLFPIGPPSDDTELAQQLLSRNEQLTPSVAEQAAIQSLITKISQILEKIVANPDSFTPVAIDEIREVGSFKKGTMLAKHNVADLLVILKSLPTTESVNALGQKLVTDLKEEHKEVFGCVTRDFGCEIAGTQAVVRVLVTIVPQNAALLEPDLHLAEKVLQSNLATIRHVRWFEEHVTNTSVKMLVRLLKDLRNRYDDLKPLNSWYIELLSHYCVMHTRTRKPLPLASAYKRFLHILSTGMLLPTSPALIDPCDPTTRINYKLGHEEMDSICSTAQTLFRVMMHGGSEHVVGVAKNLINVANELTVWNDIVVTPLEKAYNAVDMEPYYGKTATSTAAAADTSVTASA